MLIGITLIGVSVLVSFLTQLMPGDFVDIMLGTQKGMLTERQIQSLRSAYGLDKPWPIQYWGWIKSIFHGSLGYSLRTGKPVLQEIGDRFQVTLELTVMSMFIGAPIGILLGALSAIGRDRLSDFILRIGALIGLSIPRFWLGLLIILGLTTYVHWLPPMGSPISLFRNVGGNLAQFIFPALTLSLGLAASLMRITRSAMLEVLQEDFVLTASSKGLSNRVVWFKHCMRNALIPVTTLIGMQFAYLLGGAVVIECVFSLSLGSDVHSLMLFIIEIMHLCRELY
jgi:peptide/nickel transport system permease protein